jgi:hypothetical protein
MIQQLRVLYASDQLCRNKDRTDDLSLFVFEQFYLFEALLKLLLSILPPAFMSTTKDTVAHNTNTYPTASEFLRSTQSLPDRTSRGHIQRPYRRRPEVL